MTDRRIVVAGGLARRPGAGGHAWVFLQYLLGFRRLGYDVLFVDRAEDGDLGFLHATMAGHGIPYEVVDGRDGAPRAEVLAALRSCELLVDVNGYLGDDELLCAAPLSLFLDIDPGFTQMWHALGLADGLGRHDVYASYGESIGSPGCAIPTCGIDWIPTRPPVVLDEWPVVPAPPDAPVTTVATWRGPFDAVEFEGRRYGLRVHEFRRFLELPARTGERFELALDIDAADGRDRAALLDHGWTLANPRDVAGAPDAYRDTIRRSGAELSVAKGMYVDTRGGWFSDRSACYLATGRPVVATETGFGDHLPTGEGLLGFSTVDEAVDHFERLRAEYPRHMSAARRVAEEHFDSDRVLAALLRAVGVLEGAVTR